MTKIKAQKQSPEKSNKIIRAIFFDLDDTLYSYKDSNSKIKAEIKTVEYFCKKHPKFKIDNTFEVFTKVKDGIKKRFPDLPVRSNRGYWIVEFLRTEHNFNQKLAQEMLDEFWKVSCENIEAYYDAEVILKYFKKKGYKLGVITNGIREWQVKRLKATGLNKYFDFVLTASDAGYEKPHKEIFNLALKKARVKPSEAVMIGDNPVRDIAPAKELGLTTVWLRRGKRYYLPIKPKQKADYQIKNFLELYEYF